MKTFYWDSFGPRAECTPRGFLKHLKHLKEFLINDEIEDCETGLASRSLSHHAPWCKTPKRSINTLDRALKPRRFEAAE